MEGSPRYWGWPDTNSMPNRFFSSLDATWLVLGDTERANFWKLIFWPETASYFFKIPLSFGLPLRKLWQKINYRLLKKRWEMEGLLLLICNSWTCLRFSALLIRQKRALAQNRKRYGDKGHPCLRPHWGVNFPFGSLFIKIKKLAEVMQFIIKSTHPSENPIFLMTLSRKDHSTRSYVLLMSSSREAKLCFPLKFSTYGGTQNP